MPQGTAPGLTDEEVTELNVDRVGENELEAVNIGLPDTPGKSRLSENEMNLAIFPPDGEAPDSLTKAVMDNLRVGAGIARDENEVDEET